MCYTGDEYKHVRKNSQTYQRFFYVKSCIFWCVPKFSREKEIGTHMQLAKQYTPNDYEPEIYALWEASGAFSPTGQGKPYSVVMPPPNANGNLHIGHALDMNLKDILASFRAVKFLEFAFKAF